MDNPPNPEFDKKLSEIRDQCDKAERDFINKCFENHRNCFEKAGEDKVERKKCNDDFNKEEEGFAKIQDECKKKFDDFVGRTDHHYYLAPEMRLLEPVKSRLFESVLFRVQDKFFNFTENQAKDFGDKGRNEIEDAGYDAFDALRNELKELEKTGNNWCNAKSRIQENNKRKP